MKRTKEFIKRNIAGEIVLVPSGQTAREFNGMVTLTGTGEFIWEHIEETESFSHLVQLILEEYEVDKDTASQDAAGFIMQLTNSLVSICCNNVLSVTGGDIYISVMTIISSVRQLVETPIYAMNEGSSPILSYNYGARRPKRVKQAIGTMAVMIFVYTAAMWTVIIVAPHFLIGIFSSDSELIKDAVPALKLYFAAFIFMDLQLSLIHI